MHAERKLSIPHWSQTIPWFFSEVPGYNQALIAIPLEGEPTLFWCDHTIEWARRGVLGTIREDPWIEVKTWSEISDVVKEICTKNNVKNIGFEGKDIIRGLCMNT